MPNDIGANNVYDITVGVSDGVHTATKVVAITVGNVNDIAPVITSAATASFVENATGVVYTASATDADVLAVAMSYTLGGTDAPKFSIDSATGAVRFASAPNYEAPADSSFNNVYDLTVTAHNGANNSAAQAVAVTVSNVYEAPLITSAASASFNQGGTGIAYTGLASHEAGTTLVYSIGGTDKALFTVDSATGALRFASTPSTTSPQDAGANNVYDLTVSASDGSNSSAAQAVAITVTAVAAAGDAVIDLGSYGMLIAPVRVEGAWYYYWDLSGDGTNADAGSLNYGRDTVQHSVLDVIFTSTLAEVNAGATGTGTATTDLIRYATLNGVKVALPSANGGLEYPEGIDMAQYGTTYSDVLGGNQTTSSFNELLAIWDAWNGVGNGEADDARYIRGLPTDWYGGRYWSATPSGSAYVYVDLSQGRVVGPTAFDAYIPRYVALQVLP